MKDVTVQVVKYDNVYRIVVTDDAESPDNAKPNDWKTNTNVFDQISGKEEMLAKVRSILSQID